MITIIIGLHGHQQLSYELQSASFGVPNCELTRREEATQEFHHATSAVPVNDAYTDNWRWHDERCRCEI